MPNQTTRARRRRLENLTRLERSLEDDPCILYDALAQSLERGVPKRSHRGTNKRPARDLWRTKLCSAFEERGWCPDGERCTFAHGTGELTNGKVSLTLPTAHE